MPELRIGVHHRLGDGVVAARSALDQIRGKGERRTRESDECGLVVEFVEDQPDGPCDRAHRLGVKDWEVCHVVGGPHRMRDDRAGTGHDVEVDSGGLERDDDVGEQDCGVDVVAPHRLHGDFTDHRRIEARLEHSVIGTNGTVFRQGSAGLPHEPHGATCGRASGRGSDERHLGMISARAGRV